MRRHAGGAPPAPQPQPIRSRGSSVLAHSNCVCRSNGRLSGDRVATFETTTSGLTHPNAQQCGPSPAPGRGGPQLSVRRRATLVASASAQRAGLFQAGQPASLKVRRWRTFSRAGGGRSQIRRLAGLRDVGRSAGQPHSRASLRRRLCREFASGWLAGWLRRRRAALGAAALEGAQIAARRNASLPCRLPVACARLPACQLLPGVCAHKRKHKHKSLETAAVAHDRSSPTRSGLKRTAPMHSNATRGRIGRAREGGYPMGGSQ